MFSKSLRILSVHHPPKLFLRCFSNLNIESAEFESQSQKILKYKPLNKLEFDKEGKCLLYYDKTHHLRHNLRYSKELAPLFGLTIGISFFIENNPYLGTLMFLMDLYLFFRLYEIRNNTLRMVKEIYLHKDGETLELIYNSKYLRTLNWKSGSQVCHIPSFRETEEKKRLNSDAEFFPSKNIKGGEDAWMWIKCIPDSTDYFVIPKQSEHLNMDVLTAALNGKRIDTSEENIVNVPSKSKEKL